MRVLHVEAGRHLYGGAQQVLDLLAGLQGRGLENGLICPRGAALAQRAADFAQVFPLPMHGDLDLALIPRILGILRRFQPDLVHLHSRSGADVLGGIAGRLAGLPVIHSRRVDNPESPRWVALKYRLYDRVIAISQGIGEILLAEGLPPEKLRVVRSAVDAAAFARPCQRERIDSKLGLPVGSRLLGVVAQLIPRKGHRYLLQALPELFQAFPDLRVGFFGQGSLENDLRQTIHRLGLGARVQLYGFRPDLPEILPCLELLVHPALKEGLGVSLLQAASAGVPIVASRVGGIPEAVESEGNGLLVPPGDAQALGAAIARILADPALGRRLGQRGQEKMRAEFSLDAMVAGNLQVYRELVP